MQVDLTHYWYRRSLHIVTLVLLPFSWLFAALVFLRRWLYQIGLIKSYRFNVPVIVVGNITVGGTGKTPFVIWLAKFLQKQGYTPGIVSRGVGGKKHKKPHLVETNDKAKEVGDEALLLFCNTQVPVVICTNRVAAVGHLLKHSHCDIVISDDGLQHYRLGPKITIAMVDSKRLFGNHCLLPAGPLREAVGRLKKFDFVIMNGDSLDGTYTMSIEATKIVALNNDEQTYGLNDFPVKKVHALAGIGHPERFFTLLKTAGFDVIEHKFSDHYLYQAQDILFADSLPIIMTEKDAVKCKEFADERYWYVKIDVRINHELAQEILAKLT